MPFDGTAFTPSSWTNDFQIYIWDGTQFIANLSDTNPLSLSVIVNKQAALNFYYHLSQDAAETMTLTFFANEEEIGDNWYPTKLLGTSDILEAESYIIDTAGSGRFVYAIPFSEESLGITFTFSSVGVDTHFYCHIIPRYVVR